jgi:hypothetical protein
MGLKELELVHRMLKEKSSGLKYFHEWLKVLKPTSWRIYHMRNIDQREWVRIKTFVDSTISRKEKDLKEYIKVENIQRQNTTKLKKIIEKEGCITISKFGMIASHSAWLIVQHSVHDREFQKQYLKMLKENKEDVFIENIESLRRRLSFYDGIYTPKRN